MMSNRKQFGTLWVLSLTFLVILVFQLRYTSARNIEELFQVEIDKKGTAKAFLEEHSQNVLNDQGNNLAGKSPECRGKSGRFDSESGEDDDDDDLSKGAIFAISAIVILAAVVTFVTFMCCYCRCCCFSQKGHQQTASQAVPNTGRRNTAIIVTSVVPPPVNEKSPAYVPPSPSAPTNIWLYENDKPPAYMEVVMVAPYQSSASETHTEA